MAEIKLEGIEKRFKDTTIIRNLNLTIKDKEFFTFVGPSGCGKSTILNMIAGLEDVTSGTIYFDGTPVNTLPPGDRNVAMVFQSYALYPHMTVYENIAFPLRIRKQPKERIEAEINRVTTLLGVNTLLHRKPKELSGGQRQRVALGRAIIRKPRVFLMDEPLSNLDAGLRIEMRGELKGLHRKFQITTVYVTHDQEEAMVLSDRIAVLYQEKILQCGHPIEVYTKPANLFVAQFIGTPPMNLINGEPLRKMALFSPTLQQFEGRDIVVGIRPRDVAVSATGTDKELKAEVFMLEPTGSDIWVDSVWMDTKIKGRTTPDENLTIGGKAFLKIPVDKIHIFDKTTQERLC